MAVNAKYKKEIGRSLRKQRESIGISQRKVALDVGIANVSLSDIENGNIFPSESVFMHIVKILFKDSPSLQKDLFGKYAKAKGVIPPDIAAYLNKNPEIFDFLREMMEKNISSDKIIEIRNQLQDSINR